MRIHRSTVCCSTEWSRAFTRSKTHSWTSVRTLTNADLDAGPDARDVPYPVAALRGDGQTLPDALAFRAEVAAGYLARLRDAGNGVGDGVELVPITFPPPMSLLTGVDFKKYSQHADSVMIKFFTMHWPMIVTYWAQAITSMNPGLDAGRVARAVSTLFDMEDEASGDIDHYVYPGPDDAHPAGTAVQSRKIRQATGEAGGMPIPPSVHAYGPIDDVERRWRIGRDAGEHGMWINRYGYLSQ